MADYERANAALHRAMIAVEKAGGRAGNHWVETSRERTEYGFGYTDAAGEWSYQCVLGKPPTRTLIRPAGLLSPAEALMAAHDAIMLGQTSTSPEERRFAMDCRDRALDLRAGQREAAE